jgi:putative FmdB family regulatory protein
MDFIRIEQPERSIESAERPMPIYEYECIRCSHRFERVMKVGEAGAICPKCGGEETKKRISPFRTNAWSTFLDGMEKRVSPQKFK